MSRIGTSPITVPSGVTVDITTNNVKVTGPKGELTHDINNKNLKFNQEDSVISIERKTEDKSTRAYHGMIRAQINNMVEGVTKGYKKQLEVNGVGFKVNVSGKALKLALGLSHEVVFDIPEGVNVTNEENVITVEGIDKQQVGQVASQIRELKKPEPYKGKGIKYVDEYIIRKAGKAAAGAGE